MFVPVVKTTQQIQKASHTASNSQHPRTQPPPPPWRVGGWFRAMRSSHASMSERRTDREILLIRSPSATYLRMSTNTSYTTSVLLTNHCINILSTYV